jgi:hypothetical protein
LTDVANSNVQLITCKASNVSARINILPHSPIAHCHSQHSLPITHPQPASLVHMTKPPIVKVHKQRHILKRHVKFNFRNQYDSIGSDVGRAICLSQ